MRKKAVRPDRNRVDLRKQPRKGRESGPARPHAGTPSRLTEDTDADPWAATVVVMKEPGRDDDEASGPRDPEATTLDIGPGAGLDPGTDGGREPEGDAGGKAPHRRKRSRSTRSDTDREGDHATSRAVQVHPDDEELNRLAAQIHSTVNELGSLLMEALPRKLRLGELLAKARSRCKGRRGAWSTFLNTCRIKERAARESIQFFRRRGEIGKLNRHDGAALTVTAARMQLSKPRTKAEPRRAGKTIDDPGGLVPGTNPSHPLPGETGGPPGGNVVGSSSRGRAAEGDHGHAVAVAAERPIPVAPPQTDPGLSPLPAEITTAPADHVLDEYTIHDIVGCLIAYLDRALSKMTSDPADPVLADLRRAAPLMRDVHRRIEAALEANEATKV
jgi:hypothetical protein